MYIYILYRLARIEEKQLMIQTSTRRDESIMYIDNGVKPGLISGVNDTNSRNTCTTTPHMRANKEANFPSNYHDNHDSDNNSNNFNINDLKNVKKIKKGCKNDDIDNDNVKSLLSGEGVGVNGHKIQKKYLKKSKNLDINFYSPFDSIDNHEIHENTVKYMNDDVYEIYDMRDDQVPLPSPLKGIYIYMYIYLCVYI
jgi:hypothetical protein